ncbi:MAG TPA: TRAFs-binding domain-containing protein [Vicinamibacterales bacterium]|nr:TRAFs-binding domain-containing protein [Vicinamibacterales bacterium]
MPWEDVAAERELRTALALFEWSRADEITRALVKRIRREDTVLAPARALAILKLLRGANRFDALALAADAILQSGLRAGGVIVLYAQALIECGYLEAAERLLDAPSTDPDEAEVQGLKGRILKDRYVKAGPGASARYREYLSQSIEAYLRAYRVNPSENSWHGINVVALLCRGERDGVRRPALPNARAIARDVLASVNNANPDPWQVATALEASLALDDAEGAVRLAREYAAHADATAFHLSGTLRQLTEVWQLTEQAPPGSSVLPILQAALLRRPCGGLRLRTEPDGSLRVIAEPAARGLEKNFGTETFATFEWYQKGLDRCRAVARIENVGSGAASGTGWLVIEDALMANGSSAPVLVTNAHVINLHGSAGALQPKQARANFQVTQTRCPVGELIWSSPFSEFDVTIARLPAPPAGVAPLPISDEPLVLPEPPQRAPRLYIIGYPASGDLQLSLRDNEMLASDERYVHYRTPTAPGSSGSPVFDENGWSVVALHHAGRENMNRLDGKPGVYDANEGIAIRAIRRAIAANPASPR